MKLTALGLIALLIVAWLILRFLSSASGMDQRRNANERETEPGDAS
jgi:hypothetical protein